jgi:hypothetical protein
LCMSTTFMIVNQVNWRVGFCSYFLWKCHSSLVMINGISWCVKLMFCSSIFIICKPSLLEFLFLYNKPFSLQKSFLLHLYSRGTLLHTHKAYTLNMINKQIIIFYKNYILSSLHKLLF